LTSPGAAFRNVQFLDEAADDLRSLFAQNNKIATEAFRLLRELDAGRITPTPLQDYAKTGDLSDCGKIVVALEGEPEHRIVVRDIDGTFHVSEVVSVANRAEDLPYLLAGLRLERLDDPVRRSDAARRIDRVTRLLGSGD
jgi:chromosome segregation ATPase